MRVRARTPEAASSERHRRRGVEGLERGRLAVSLWLRLLKSHNLIVGELRKRLQDACTFPQFDVLAQLAREPDGTSMMELSRRLLVTAGNMTGVVNRLERDGLVRRQQDQRDRRVTRIRLTPRGRAVARTLVPRHGRDIGQILGVLHRGEQRLLRDLLGRLNRRLEEHLAAGTPMGRRPASGGKNSP